MPVLCVEIIARRSDLSLTPYQQIQTRGAFLDALSRLAPSPNGVVLTCSNVLPWPQGVFVHAWCVGHSAEDASETLADHLAKSLTSEWEWRAGTTYVACDDN